MTTNPDSALGSGKGGWVRSMFAQIAPRYDLLNHLLSLGIDRHWRRFTAKKLARVLERPGARALDLCCGTADLSIELSASAETWAVDFCHEMLVLGLKKVTATGRSVFLLEGDSISVPFANSQFDAVTIAFGLRNLESIADGLREIYRVLKPGGRAAVLEFSRPIIPVFRQAFEFYFRRILPRIGKAVSGSKFAYQYLPASVRAFPDQKNLAAMMLTVGFSNVKYYNLSGGIAALHLGDRE